MKCIWCGTEILDKGKKCAVCRARERTYISICKNMSRHSDLNYLLYYRNFLLDLKYNLPKAKDLPQDLDYQYDRVTRYISEKEPSDR